MRLGNDAGMQKFPCHFPNNLLYLPAPNGRFASADLPRTSAFSLDDQSLPWVPFTPYCEAVEFKYLRLDPVRSEIVCFVRTSAGARMPQRYHYGRIITYTVEGSWKFLEYDWIAGPGSTVFEPPALAHTFQTLEEKGQCITLNIISGDVILLSAGGDAPAVENWRSAMHRYLAYCERASVQPTDLTVSA